MGVLQSVCLAIGSALMIYKAATTPWGLVLYQGADTAHPFTRLMTLRRPTTEPLIPLYSQPVLPTNLTSSPFAFDPSDVGSNTTFNTYHGTSNITKMKTRNLPGLVFESFEAAEVPPVQLPVNTTSTQQDTGSDWRTPESEHGIRYPTATGIDWVALVLRILAEYFLLHNHLIQAAYLADACMPIALASVLCILFGCHRIRQLRNINKKFQDKVTVVEETMEAFKIERDTAVGDAQTAANETRSANERAQKAEGAAKEADKIINQLKTTNSQLVNTISEHQATIGKQKSSALDAEKKISSLKRDVQQAQGDITSKIEQARQQRSEQAENSRAVVAEKDLRLKSQGQSITSLKNEVKGLKEQLEQVRSDARKQADEKHEVRRRADGVDKQLKELKEKVSEDEKRGKVKRDEDKKTISDLNRQVRELNELRRENKELEKALKTTRQALASSDDSLKKAQSQPKPSATRPPPPPPLPRNHLPSATSLHHAHSRQ